MSKSHKARQKKQTSPAPPNLACNAPGRFFYIRLSGHSFESVPFYFYAFGI